MSEENKLKNLKSLSDRIDKITESIKDIREMLHKEFNVPISPYQSYNSGGSPYGDIVDYRIHTVHQNLLYLEIKISELKSDIERK